MRDLAKRVTGADVRSARGFRRRLHQAVELLGDSRIGLNSAPAKERGGRTWVR
jgi:hypothetical protein